MRALAAILTVTALASPGCDAGNPRPCTVSCSDLGLCPAGTTCGMDGYCHGPGEVPDSCASAGEPDGGTGGKPDGSVDLPDAAQPDAADPRPDACAGPEAFGDFRTPMILIPDDDPFGVTSTIVADSLCTAVESVEIGVDITHGFRGDIQLELTSPSGETVVVLAPSSDATPDIHEFFSVNIASGEDAGGAWVLTVADPVAVFSGTLDRWSIGINQLAP
jgi:hypothetical protein